MKKIVLLSNVTMDFLAGTLSKKVQTYLSVGFDSWQREIYTEQSGLYQFAPDVVVILLYADAYQDCWVNRVSGEYMIDEWMMAVKKLSDRIPGIPILVSDIDIRLFRCHYGAEKRLEIYFEQYMTEALESLHAEGRNVYILPVKAAAADLGRKQFYSHKMWYMGSMPYSMKGIAVLSDLIFRYLSSTVRKKCMAVDLDNTLWGGVIGEDGVQGIVLADHNEGARYKDTQRVLKKMRQQGVMLAILSKNNPEDVEAAMSHPDMILHHEDFVAEAVNWGNKAQNIRDMARNLNIGLDSFVFLDDNPAEREQMKELCPEVSILDFPKDTSLLPDVVEKAYEDYFFSLEVSQEDLKKTDMYRNEVKRKDLQKSAVSVDDYLKKLEMKIDIHYMKPEEEKRVTQLINKTNQFNLTAIRYSEAEVHQIAESPDCEIITVRMSDKYGDQGLVAIMILRYEGAKATIDTFLMSCRVMGRKAEDLILQAVSSRAAQRGCSKLVGSFIRTAKNKPVEDLYNRFGFEVIEQEENDTCFKKIYEIKIEELRDAHNVFHTVCMFED